MVVPILYREELKEHDFGSGHPFGGDRYQIFPRFLKENLSSSQYRFVKADWAEDKDLALICQKEYIEFVKDYYEAAHAGLTTDSRYSQFLSRDNVPRARPGNLEQAARLIVGQAKSGIDLILEGKTPKAVSLGGGMHHAKPNYGEGFCIYNDVAFAAKYCLKNYSQERILILDTDAHAGNGTAEYFYESPQVLFIDLHQYSSFFYPGTGNTDEIGLHKGKGFTVNCPLATETGWDSYQYIFEEVVFPMAKEFTPQIVIRNGGSDPYWNDTLTQLGLEVDDFRKIGERVGEMAQICEGKELDLIGSGYNREALGPAWLALICGLADIDISIEEPTSLPQRFRKDSQYDHTKDMVKELKSNLKKYWNCFTRI